MHFTTVNYNGVKGIVCSTKSYSKFLALCLIKLEPVFSCSGYEGGGREPRKIGRQEAGGKRAGSRREMQNANFCHLFMHLNPFKNKNLQGCLTEN